MQAACVRIAIDLKLFHVLDTDDSLKTAADLPKLCGADEVFMIRILRMLSSLNFIEEVDVLTYSTSPIAHALTDPPLEAMCIHVYDQGLPSIANLPAYMKQTSHQSPSDGENGPFQARHKTNLPAFDFWVTQPEVFTNFNTFMKNNDEDQAS